MRSTFFRSVALLIVWWCASIAASPSDDSSTRVALGQRLFADTQFSRSGSMSCQSCHDPAHAYADSRRHSIGDGGTQLTRNAPSLIGIGNRRSFFWDGRRTTLESTVLDAATNPSELGFSNVEDVLIHLRQDKSLADAFARAFPSNPTITEDNLRSALAAFIRSLTTHPPGHERSTPERSPLIVKEEHGRQLFFGAAGCSECHHSASSPESFTDERYHHSGVSQEKTAPRQAGIVRAVEAAHLDAASLGIRIIRDEDWSSLGRFCVSYSPSDIGAFRTPSLLNVSTTAPYMHDGSIATLSQAVDQEIYYRSFSSGRPIDLSQSERDDLVAFLTTL